ncbi:hypothetical protein VA596_47355 [Amycolatopsis sp., V23-08]|uniref:Uncharacterized protein n=1 Tax=Amycolatopsis heterodermiae TaxID=3110235 RepID=A0ABU5RLQ6_9PSEU|nr:hypothetical protein [Amycolatopsis sp., V23-08]MEA5367217.1 hypothetical protein [Amycolatopsis sp., V23-08]
MIALPAGTPATGAASCNENPIEDPPASGTETSSGALPDAANVTPDEFAFSCQAPSLPRTMVASMSFQAPVAVRYCTGVL